MDYELTLSNGTTPYVIARAFGAATKAITHRFLEEAQSLGKEHSVACFLFDLTRTASRKSILDDYLLAYRGLREIGFTRQSQAALLVARDDASTSSLRSLYATRVITGDSSRTNVRPSRGSWDTNDHPAAPRTPPRDRRLEVRR